MNSEIVPIGKGKMSVEKKVTLSQEISRFDSKVTLEDEKGNMVNLKSILGLINFTIMYGTCYEINIEGRDEKNVLSVIQKYFRTKS